MTAARVDAGALRLDGFDEPWPSHLERLKPSFLVIGAQRCGTTSLIRYLRRCSEFAPPRRKELHYFDWRHHKGVEWYASQFPQLRTRRLFGLGAGGSSVGLPITGEATPAYLSHPLAPERIARLLPDVKLLALLRNPVDRAYSQHHHSVQRGRETLSFEEAIEREPERLGGELEKELADETHISQARVWHSYRTRGCYAEQFERWLAHFPREQMLIVRSEKFFRQTDEVFAEMLQFLGLKAPYLRRWRVHNNSAARSAPMSAEMRRRLETFYEPHNRRLEELLGCRFDWSD